MNTSQLTNEMIENAYSSLEEKDKAIVDAQVASVISKMKTRKLKNGKTIPFGEKQALELLARLGIWMIENKAGLIEP